MTVKIRKKASRMRGSKTHGWGAKKKHRGAGNRGGRGMAGTGKRADAKKPSIWKNRKPYFGKRGFKVHNKKQVRTITLRELDTLIPKWFESKKINKDGNAYTINLSKLNYDKLLGTGRINYAINLTVKFITPKAEEKIKAKKGTVTIANNNSSAPTNEAEAKEEPSVTNEDSKE